MTIAALGLVIWGVLVLGGWLFGTQLAGFAIRAVLFGALITMSLIGFIRFLLDVVTTVTKAAVEIVMVVLGDTMQLVCKLLRPDQQKEWSACCTELTLWARARGKTVFGDGGASGTEDQNDNKPDQDQVSGYDWALKIMGLENETDLTLPKLKQRYRQMMTVVHPDKQFPNHVFAQQVNDSVETIKRRNGWH